MAQIESLFSNGTDKQADKSGREDMCTKKI